MLFVNYMNNIISVILATINEKVEIAVKINESAEARIILMLSLLINVTVIVDAAFINILVVSIILYQIFI